MFLSDRVLFSDTNMRVVRAFYRDMESDFGVEANIFTVPITTSNNEMISVILEYMANRTKMENELNNLPVSSGIIE